MDKVQLKIIDQRLADNLPQYATVNSAGLDLCAAIHAPVEIQPGETILIGTGFALNINDSTLMAMLAPRSGLGHKHGIVLGNLIGVIDSDYQGEVKISCWNRSSQPFTINPMDRIAQMVIVPIVQVYFEVVEEFDSATVRGAGGFGSTGK